MKKIFFLLLLGIWFQKIGQAQCNIPVPPSATCANAPILCDLDGYCSQLISNNFQPSPSPFCGQIENSHWLSFIAGSEDIDILVTPFNCLQNDGMQGHMYRTDDCSNFQAISNCWDPGGLGPIPFTLSASNLTIGERYYILFDGKGGDVCEYLIEVTLGFTTSPDFLIPEYDPAYICVEGFSNELQVSNNLSEEGDAIYFWETLDGSIIDGQNALVPTVELPGIYTLTAEDTLLECVDTLVLEVLQADDLIAEVAPSDTITCETSYSIVLSPEQFSSSPTISYEWRTLSDSLIGDNVLFVEVDEPGWYIFIVKDNASGCDIRDTAQISIDIEHPIASAGESEELNCVTPNIILQGGASSIGPEFEYSWMTIGGNILEGYSTLFPVTDTPGMYFLEVLDNNNGCTAIDSVEIILNEKVPEGADLTIERPCFGKSEGSILINSVVGGNPPFRYSLDDIDFIETPDFQNLPIDEYPLTIRDEIGCEWDTTIAIYELAELILELEPDLEIKLGEEINLPALVNRPEQILTKIQWLPTENLSCDTCLNPIANPYESTRYDLFIADENGCTTEGFINLEINKAACVYIPNAFSPNGDGHNDRFYLHGVQNIEMINQFLVFDRWGSLVYEEKKIQPNDPTVGWDGTFLGQNLNSGVFIYYVEIQFIDGRKEIFRGDVLLIK